MEKASSYNGFDQMLNYFISILQGSRKLLLNWQKFTCNLQKILSLLLKGFSQGDHQTAQWKAAIKIYLCGLWMTWMYN